ncbi:ArnT family glycosyltransferase [Rhodomicrobium lacus]|uniref:ArnT family glycosyltransferase n=1 Tax=Rhodomicrobium lacus TaxID=2498452 RepID=UPI0026E2CDC9|nr:glycosyltransferase family 39 protein [Rhodomicrobium lacus]WKW52376.1 glycosyltransferase family 39 protein [Rhodomicrobium lacus]
MEAITVSVPRAHGDTSRLAAVDVAVAKGLRALAYRPYAAVLGLALLCALLFLPGIASLPVTDRDEARFAQATKQMLETGDFVDIHFQQETRYKKPVGIYWLQSAAVTAAESAGATLTDIWAYRIPSFLGALGAVLLTFWAARGIFGRETALVAATLFATCLTLSFEARIAKSDAALIAAIVLAQGALFRLYMASDPARTRGLAALFWIGLGVGILIKGPVAPGLSFITAAVVLIFDRRRTWLRNLHWKWGVPLLLLLTLPWFIAIGVSSGGAFFKASLGQDFAGKLASGQEKHWGPPGFYFLAFWWTFWPAVLFVTGGAIAWLWRQRRVSRRVLFLLAWIVPWWLIIEAIPTKLPHYALPLYPAIAMAAAFAFREAAQGVSRARLSAVLWATLATAQIVLLLGLSWIAEAPAFPLLAAVLVALAAVSAFTAASAWGRYSRAALAGAVVSAALFYIAAFRVGLPGLEPIWITRSAAAAAEKLRGCGDAPVAFGGISEPSLVFMNGTRTILGSVPGSAEALGSGAARLAFVNGSRREMFEKAFEEKTGAAPRVLGCVDGVNINGRGPTRLVVFARPETAALPACVPVPDTECRDKQTVRWRRLFDTKF